MCGQTCVMRVSKHIRLTMSYIVEIVAKTIKNTRVPRYFSLLEWIHLPACAA